MLAGMTVRLDALSFDTQDPQRVAAFWAGLFGWPQVDNPWGGVDLIPDDDTGFRLRFQPGGGPWTGPNQVHFDLTSNTHDQQETVARVLELGGRHYDAGQLPEEEHVPMADPEGNEFCVIEPGNNFLADCGFIGALSSDGTQALGYFWSAALDWPLVWDQDEETAIRSPHGGPKIAWGGPPLAPKQPRNRLHLDLVAEGDLAVEVERLVSLGAARTDVDDVLTDPDGNTFYLRAQNT
jgi:predicted enzyme related to lactoylglutathione lyase